MDTKGETGVGRIRRLELTGYIYIYICICIYIYAKYKIDN